MGRERIWSFVLAGVLLVSIVESRGYCELSTTNTQTQDSSYVAGSNLKAQGSNNIKTTGTAMTNRLSVAGPNSQYKLPGAKPAGFWAGLWHGIIIAITYIISLFNSNVRIYEINNTGRGYDFGFMIGVSGIIGGGIKWFLRR
ncbi:MAG: hypothetical protein PHX21_04950 [bacterium]|nr:hypothetical protein [bacterium]